MSETDIEDDIEYLMPPTSHPEDTLFYQAFMWAIGLATAGLWWIPL